MFGFLNIHKPAGPTSHDVVAAVRRRLPRRTRVGHAGTLDPFAEGVLVVCVGPATRLAEYVQAGRKAYRAVVRLGARSSTDDVEGEMAPAPDAAAPSESAVRAALGRFVGEIAQRPPAHSAVHVDGRRAYQLARAGEQADLPARPVTIHRAELLRYVWPDAEVLVECGSGTYIRAIARDLGEALGVGGYCQSLVRAAVGAFTIQQAVRMDDLDPARDLVPAAAGLDMTRVLLDEHAAGEILLGRSIPVPPTSSTTPSLVAEPFAPSAPAADPPGPLALLAPDGMLLAVAGLRAGRLHPHKVFPPTP